MAGFFFADGWWVIHCVNLIVLRTSPSSTCIGFLKMRHVSDYLRSKYQINCEVKISTVRMPYSSITEEGTR